MIAKMSIFVSLFIAILISFAGVSNAETIFFDDFNDGKISGEWNFVNGDWVEGSGILSQKDANSGTDPVKALLEIDHPDELTVQAKVRIDKWSGANPSRGGVSVRTDKSNGQGFNLSFRGDPPDKIWFLDDFVAWGNSVPFNWEEGNWYYFQMRISAEGEMFGKVWADGTTEPKDFMLEQNDWVGKRPDGLPGLNGGNTGSAVSFDDVKIWDANGPSPNAVSMSSKKLAITWGLMKR